MPFTLLTKIKNGVRKFPSFKSKDERFDLCLRFTLFKFCSRVTVMVALPTNLTLASLKRLNAFSCKASAQGNCSLLFDTKIKRSVMPKIFRRNSNSLISVLEGKLECKYIWSCLLRCVKCAFLSFFHLRLGSTIVE